MGINALFQPVLIPSIWRPAWGRVCFSIHYCWCANIFFYWGQASILFFFLQNFSFFFKFPAFPLKFFNGQIEHAHKNRWMGTHFVTLVQLFPSVWKCNNASCRRAVNFILICQWLSALTISSPFNPALAKVEHHSSYLSGTAPLKHSLWQVSARGAVW